jgi:hypothetical protein
MPAWVFKRWEAFFALEPWGWRHDRECAGVVAASVHNANPWRSARSRVLKVTDFIPKMTRPLTPAQIKIRSLRERDELMVHAIKGGASVYSADGLPLDPLSMIGAES